MSTARIESDSIGEIEVPADAYWGAQTERSRHNFAFPPHERMPLPVVHALARIKGAAARVNRTHGLDARLADAIAAAADAVVAGEYDDQLPLAIWQTGSGTQSNMNANEVIAGIANESLVGTRGGKAPAHWLLIGCSHVRYFRYVQLNQPKFFGWRLHLECYEFGGASAFGLGHEG